MKPLVKTLCSVFLMSCFGFVGSHAGWIENGVPLTHQWGGLGGGVIASDGSSGAIIALRVCDNGVGHIIAQHVDSLGILLWGEEGVGVCMGTGDPQAPQITSDGAGGAIIMWQDYRGGHFDIYAQRVNASGAVQWTADGVLLCTAPGNEQSPAITSDGAGGAIVTWKDYRSGTYPDIYAQKVNASGAVQWTADGVALCTATGSQYSPTIISDGAGGAVVTWYDARSGNLDIYAQRVNASGAVQWTVNGVALCTATGNQQSSQITSDGTGGAIVTWEDWRGATLDIYAQRVNASGAVQWTADGVPLCTATGDQQYPTITSDGSGGAIVTWQDYRGGSSGSIYAQRVNASGTVQWTTDGVAITAAWWAQSNATITSDGTGGAIVTWYDGHHPWSGYDIYAQRVNASGAVEWTANGLALCTATGDQQFPQITSDGAGGAIVTWLDQRSGIKKLWDIYAQRVNASGAVQWTADGVVLCSMATVDQYAPQITSDGAGGAIVTWYKNCCGNADIYAQRVNASGFVLWTANGVALCTATTDQWAPQMTSDGAGGAIVAWADWRNGSRDIYAQRVDASGAVQWTPDGVSLCTATGNQQSPQITSDGAGGAIVTWYDYRSGNYDIYAQRVNASGAVQWTANGVPLCTATGDQWNPTITSDGAGGAIVTWESNDIYAQRVNASGAIQWATDGVPICTATGIQANPAIVSDGAGGAIVTWDDVRGEPLSYIYAQRVNASGAVQWTANGIRLCTTGTYEGEGCPQITSDGAGGAIVTWQEYPYGMDHDIYAQRVNASGAIQWATEGVALCTAAWDQCNPRITSDGAGGAIVTWYDNRSGSLDTPKYDVYAQRVNASGAVQWTSNGVALCAAGGDQQYPTITSDGAGGAVVTWEDHRCGQLTYAQRIRASGEIVATTLQNYSAALEGTAIHISWGLSEIDTGARFLILRASAPDWEYIELDGAAIAQERLSFSFTDSGCLPGSTYKYRVECEVEGTARRVLFETEAIAMPALPVTLYQNHPNPFNPHTVIRFYLPEAQEISLDIYDVTGERVVRLAEGRTEKGYHEVRWDGRNSSGTVCSSGVYFSRLKAGKSTISRKMVIMR